MPVAMASTLLFVLTGAYRLARYNTLPSDRRAYFKGLPIPAGCFILMTGSFWQHWVINIWWVVLVVAVGYLMVSNISYPKNIHVIRAPLWLLAGMGICVIGWGLLTGGLRAVPFGIFALYGLSGPVMFVYRLALHRHSLRNFVV